MPQRAGELRYDITASTQRLRQQLSTANRAINRHEREVRGIRRQYVSANQSARAFRRSLGGIAALGAGFGLVALSRQVLSVGVEFEQLRIRLETATGSAEEASRVYDQLQQFGATTAFQFGELVEVFQQLALLNFAPTIQDIRDIGEVASAIGRPIGDLQQALASAGAGEFEPLRRFGIRFRKEGDTLRATFRGVETTLQNTERAILDYVANIGRTNFGGATERQANSLAGALSNLQDTADSLSDSFVSGGLGDALARTARATSEAGNGFNDLAGRLGFFSGVAVDAARENANLLDGLTLAAIGARALGTPFNVASQEAVALRESVTPLRQQLRALNSAQRDSVHRATTLTTGLRTMSEEARRNTQPALQQLSQDMRRTAGEIRAVQQRIANTEKSFSTLANASRRAGESFGRLRQAAANFGRAIATTFGTGAVIFLAVEGLQLLYDALTRTSREAKALREETDAIAASMRSVSQNELRSLNRSLSKLESQIKTDREELAKLNDQIAQAQAREDSAPTFAGRAAASKQLNELTLQREEIESRILDNVTAQTEALTRQQAILNDLGTLGDEASGALDAPTTTIPQVEEIGDREREQILKDVQTASQAEADEILERNRKILEADRERLEEQRQQRGELLNEVKTASQAEADEILEKNRKILEADRRRYEEQQQLTAQFAKTAAQSLGSFFDTIIDGETSASDALRELAKNIAFAAIQTQLLQTAFGQSDFGGAIIGSIFGRQGGGPVSPGRPYIVGERGPEIVSFDRAGFVTPNHVLTGSGGGQVINVTVNGGDREGARRGAYEGTAAALRAQAANDRRRPGVLR